MFNSISWSSYFECIFFFLLPYYAVVLLVYYRKDLQFKFTQMQQPRVDRTSIDPIGGAAHEKKDNSNNDHSLFSSVHDLLEELKAVFQNANNKKSPKEELLMALQSKLKSYPQLKGTAFQVAVNNHIVQQAASECAMALDENEIKNCW